MADVGRFSEIALHGSSRRLMKIPLPDVNPQLQDLVLGFKMPGADRIENQNTKIPGRLGACQVTLA